MIKHVGNGRYIVVSENGKRKLSKPVSKAKAKKRLAQVDRFAAMKGRTLLG